MEALEDQIRRQKLVVNAGTGNKEQRAKSLQALAVLLKTKYDRSADTSKLDDGIHVMHESVSLTPSGHADRVGRLKLLEDLVSDKWSATKDLQYLNQSLQLKRDIVEATPKDDPGHPSSLNYLAMGLLQIFTMTGDTACLSESIELAKIAVRILEEDQDDRFAWASTLAVLLYQRYHSTKVLLDLLEAIDVTRVLVESVQETHLHWPMFANNLAIYLIERYHRSGNQEDLESSIELSRRVLDVNSDMSYAHTLANGIHERYRRQRTGQDLDEAIELIRDALDNCPPADERLPELHNAIGDWLLERCEKTGNERDQKQSMMHLAHAVAICSETHVDWAKFTYDLGRATAKRFMKDGAFNDYEDTIFSYRRVLQDTNSTIQNRIYAGAALVPFYTLGDDWEQAHKTVSATMPLVPKLMPQSFGASDKQDAVRIIAGFASIGAAVALNNKAGPVAALEILEQGRGLFAASIDDLRTDIVELQEHHPDIAQRLMKLRNDLETPIPLEVPQFSMGSSSDWQDNASVRHSLGIEFDCLIEEVRKLDGFEDFLLPPKVAQLHSAAEFGPIVLVNVSEPRCDAIIIEAHRIQSIPLPHLDEKELRKKAIQRRGDDPFTLEYLWDAIADPVLNAIGILESPSDGQYPRLWWIPTGVLSKFPIHAAGYHFEKGNRTVMDRVVSSYSSSVKSILHTRQLGDDGTSLTGNIQALLIAEEATPGHPKLPFAKKEVESLEEMLRRSSISTIVPENTTKGLLAQLSQCKLFHFAGHGYTDIRDPGSSHLVLSRGYEKYRLTMGNLLEVNLRQTAPFLAFLSACGTARISDEEFIDENLHLINAYRLAGFRHVIGTLWEVNDEICKDIAVYTYREMMMKGEIDDASVARGLHSAILAMRSSWVDATLNDTSRAYREYIKLNGYPKRGECDAMGVTDKAARDIKDVSDEGMDTPALWAPYVHFGV